VPCRPLQSFSSLVISFCVHRSPRGFLHSGRGGGADGFGRFAWGESQSEEEEESQSDFPSNRLNQYLFCSSSNSSSEDSSRKKDMAASRTSSGVGCETAACAYIPLRWRRRSTCARFLHMLAERVTITSDMRRQFVPHTLTRRESVSISDADQGEWSNSGRK